jgi:hypothetical protein
MAYPRPIETHKLQIHFQEDDLKNREEKKVAYCVLISVVLQTRVKSVDSRWCLGNDFSSRDYNDGTLPVDGRCALKMEEEEREEEENERMRCCSERSW